MGTTKIINLTEKEKKKLESIVKKDDRYRVRNRANAILYKCQSVDTEEIAKLLNVRPQTVYLWIRNYEEFGIESFYDKEGKGRIGILTSEYKEDIKALVDNQPSLSVANARIREKLNLYVHNETLRKYLKKNKIQLYESSEETT